MSTFQDESIGEMRLVGVEDGSFKPFQRRGHSYTVLCCVEMDKDVICNVRLAHIEVDGLDATDKLLSMLDAESVDAVILGGITFAGFNVIDPSTIFQDIGVPVIVYSGEAPDNCAMLLALRRHFEDWKRRWSVIEGLDGVYETVTRPEEPPVYFEVVGGSVSWAEEVLRSSALVCRIPEPVRVAGIIARGVSRPAC